MSVGVAVLGTEDGPYFKNVVKVPHNGHLLVELLQRKSVRVGVEGASYPWTVSQRHQIQIQKKERGG